jgi:hypothetical protein
MLHLLEFGLKYALNNWIKAEPVMIMRYLIILAVLAGCAQTSVGKSDNDPTIYQSNEEFFDDFE